MSFDDHLPHLSASAATCKPFENDDEFVAAESGRRCLSVRTHRLRRRAKFLEDIVAGGGDDLSLMT